MNRREILIGSVCVAISVTARGSGRGAFSSPTHQLIGDGCVISTHSGLSVLDKGTAVFVFGCCESAISEITRLGLSLRTVAYFGGSTHGPNAEALLAGLWTVPREGIRKIDNTSEFVDWVVENHDRVALIGNFSAPFASRMLVLIAAKARKLNSLCDWSGTFSGRARSNTCTPWMGLYRSAAPYRVLRRYGARG